MPAGAKVAAPEAAEVEPSAPKVQADGAGSFLAVKKAIENVKTGVQKRDATATKTALKDAISKADALTGDAT